MNMSQIKWEEIPLKLWHSGASASSSIASATMLNRNCKVASQVRTRSCSKRRPRRSLRKKWRSRRRLTRRKKKRIQLSSHRRPTLLNCWLAQLIKHCQKKENLKINIKRTRNSSRTTGNTTIRNQALFSPI